VTELNLFEEDSIDALIRVVNDTFTGLGLENKIEALNRVRLALHEISPFKYEPVDCVLWIKNTIVTSNNYNPNSVAGPEMALLETSITNNGYTQPIVGWGVNGHIEVVDGFHRNRVGKESKVVRERVLGYLPIVKINSDREEKGDRIAATIRHNRARGKHQIGAMSEIVLELKRRNWKNERICKELGMDMDEILRLCQITGLADAFSNQEFSKAWDIEGAVCESDFKELSDDVETYGDEAEGFRTVNTSDEGRIFHTYEKWECYKAGFYNSTKPGMTKDECEEGYRAFLSDPKRFGAALDGVITQWKHSCEHYLTNSSMNRIAWLGQASACFAIGIPSEFRSGFNLLTTEEQKSANELALEYLNKWLLANSRPAVEMKDAMPDREATIY
jgi:ParB-like chromosome segregation protein Spo0J